MRLSKVFLPSKVEGVGVKVGVDGRYINFVVIYRSPGGYNIIKAKEWERLFKQFNNSSTIVLGDFNAYNIIWNCKNTDPNGSILFETSTNNGFYIINYDTLTRIGEAYQDPSNIDLAFCTEDILKDISYDQLEDSWGSDHHPVEYKLNYKIEIYKKKN